MSHESLYDQQSKVLYTLNEDTILKFFNFDDDVVLDVLEGGLRVNANSKELVLLSINHIKINANTIFAQRNKTKMKFFNTQDFMLSQYEINAEKENTILVTDLPSKKDMIEFASSFYQQKNELLSFMKQNQASYDKEFKLQTERQTKVLQRSVASVENAEHEKKIQQKKDSDELKKVRDLFFYRTFYR